MALTALQQCYAIVTTAFGSGGIFYNGGHRGADYERDAGQPIYAYDDFVIESIDYGAGLGWSVGVRRENLGGFAGFAHVKDVQGSVGTVIRKGAVLAYVAGYGDQHGSLWTGPHIHTTYGEVSAYFCSVGIRPLEDPVPSINKAVFSSAPAGGGGSAPIDNTTPANPNQEEEEDDMKPRQIHYTEGGTTYRGYFVPGTGYFIKWQDNNATIANGFSLNHETSGSVGVTKALFDYFVQAAANAAAAGK